MEKVFNKLVRDYIPKIIEDNGEIAITRVLDNEEYKKELFNKLKEECNEVVDSKNSEETLEELADLLEVMMSIMKLENKTLEDVIEISSIKRNKRGGFNDKIFLEKTISEKE